MLSNNKILTPYSVNLNEIERTVIGLGFNFRLSQQSTSTNSLSSLLSSLDKLQRRFLLNFYFAEMEPGVIDPSIPPLPSSDWLPDLSRCRWKPKIENYISTCKEKVLQLKLQSSQRSIDRFLFRIAAELSSRKDIVIKPADKNLGVSVLPATIYRDLCHQHLQDSATYAVVDDAFFHKKAYAELRRILARFDNLYIISNKRSLEGQPVRRLSKLARSLLRKENDPVEKNIGKFYCLPKLHKQPLKGRPIIASCNSLSYYASVYLHNMLYPIIQRLPERNFICNSIDTFLKDIGRLSRMLPPGLPIEVLCADVTSLYPSIPIEWGLQRMDFILRQFSNFAEKQRQFIVSLLKWVLTNNFFFFESTIYVQLQGTAMGTPVAVSYAQLILYMHDVECNRVHRPLLYRRFIDDIVVIAEKDGSPRMSPTIFLTFNNLHFAIQLEAITAGSSGNFLDLTISVQEPVEPGDVSRLAYSLFEKSTNTHQYIPFSSFHPRHILKNFIYNESRRISSHYSDNVMAEEQVQVFIRRLVARGYPPPFIQEGLNFSPTRIKGPKTPPILTLSLPRLTERINFSELFKIPQELMEDRTYQLAYGQTSLVIGKRLGANLGSFFLHPKNQRASQSVVTPQLIPGGTTEGNP
jgi:hypothetical protein